MARMPKTLRNSLISVIVLIVLFFGAGVAYTYLSGGSPPPQAVAKKPASQQTPLVAKPTPPAANAQVGVAIGSVMPAPVAAGSNVTLTARTTATATCTISIAYNGVPSKDSGLAPKAADAYGAVSWTWTVDRTAPAGNWPAHVSCTYHTRSAVAEAPVQVVK